MTAPLALPGDFPALLAAHRGIVHKVAASFARTPEDRADLAQEIAMQLWQAWPAYDPARTFSTWMYRVALNVAVSHERRERLRRHDAFDDAMQDALIGDDDVDVLARERLALLARAMTALAPIDRALLLLHLDGCSHRDTADVLGIGESNVATRLHRVRMQLKRLVAGE